MKVISQFNGHIEGKFFIKGISYDISSQTFKLHKSRFKETTEKEIKKKILGEKKAKKILKVLTKKDYKTK